MTAAAYTRAEVSRVLGRNMPGIDNALIDRMVAKGRIVIVDEQKGGQHAANSSQN